MKYPLTHPQKRIWYIQKIHAHSPLHNIGGCLKIYGHIHIQHLQKAIQAVISRNEALHLRFAEEDGQAYQYVEVNREEEVEFIDFRKYENPVDEKERWIHDVFQRSFSIESGNLSYFGIYQVSDKEYGLVVSIHHIISDGWSMSLIQKQICDLYSFYSKEEGKPEISPSYAYTDYIAKEQAYFKSDRFLKNRSFWNDKFKDLPEAFLYKSFTDLEASRKTFAVEPDLTAQIRNFLDIHKISLNTFYLAVMYLYLYKITNQSDLVLGTPILNRTDKKDKNTVGMYTSTMPLRMKLNPDHTIDQFLKDLSLELRKCLANQRYPYDMLISDLELNKKGFDSLFKIAVNYYNTQFLSHIDGIPVDVTEYNSGHQNYSLQLVVNEWSHEQISLHFDYKKSEYRDEEIEAMHQIVLNMIHQLVSEANLYIRDLRIVDDQEYHYKIVELNKTDQKYPDHIRIHELFEKQALQTPEEIALIHDEHSMTYHELNAKAEKVANFLRKQGMNEGKFVGICATHSFELVIGILGILKSDAAYVPIDPTYPITRVEYMLKDSEASILLSNIALSEELHYEGEIYDLRDSDIYLTKNIDDHGSVGSAESLAYLIYTSGSTGQPKGVMIEHRNLVNYIWWASQAYIKEKEVFALYSSISFDLTVTSIFTPLITGNQIQIYHDEQSSFILEKVLADNRTTVLKLTPAHLTLLKDMEHENRSLRRIIVGGDNLKVSTAKGVLKNFNQQVEIYNEYGPTEATVGCMIYQFDLDRDIDASVPIGLPIDNTQIYILDKFLSPVANGMEGEIYISGSGVARGYYHRSDLTNEKFVPNPFLPGATMYKTGDIATYLPDGNIMYIGRMDHQVKLRGYRIELGEIEKYLIDHPLVQDAHVMIRETEQGDKVFYAYYVSTSEQESTELKNWLVDRVPRYMIPNQFIWLEAIPLTINGKVNVAELPIDVNRPKNVIEYRDEKEKELVFVMKEVLGIDQISMNDSYFQLGGDSIKAIQIVSKLKSRQFELNVKEILEKEYIEEIALTMKELKKGVEINQSPIEGLIERSPIWEWFFLQDFQESHHFHQSILLECVKLLTKEHLQKAVDQLITHHDLLRVNVHPDSQEVYFEERYLTPGCSPVLEYDLSDLSIEEQNEKIKEIGNTVKSSFDITNQVLFRGVLFRLGGNKQYLLLTAHHLVVDGVSWRVIVEDLTTLIEQLQNEEALILPFKTHSYQTWSAQLKDYAKELTLKETEYWEDVQKVHFSLPNHLQNGDDSVGSSHVIQGTLKEADLQQFTQQLYEIYGLELHEGLILSLVFTIYEMTQSKEIVIELEGHGREPISPDLDISRTVGWFTSMYPALFKMGPESMDYNIKSVKEQLRNIPNKGFHYGLLKHLLNKWTGTKKSGIRFNYLGHMDHILRGDFFKLSSLDTGNDVGDQNHLTAELDLNAMVVANQLHLSIHYSKNCFQEETIQTFLSTYFEKIQEINQICLSKGEKEYTPSDFQAEEDISIDDLESLFE